MKKDLTNRLSCDIVHLKEKTMVVNLSDKLREMRLKRGLTQQELADKIGVSESYISQIENGKMVSIKKLDKMAKALGCEPRDLL